MTRPAATVGRGRNPASPAGLMGAQDFLAECWGAKVPGWLTIWRMANKQSHYWPHTAISDFYDYEPDVFHSIGTCVRELGRHRRPGNDNIAAICGLYLDIDGVGGTAELTYAEPTITVNSGNGIHPYYLFDDGPWIFRSVEERTQAAALVRGWVRLHPAADQSVHDLSRVMRLPETVNAKDTDYPRPVKVIKADGPRHKRADLLDLVRANLAGQTRTDAWSTPHIELTGDTSAFVAKLDALLDLSPEFAAVWHGERTFPTTKGRTNLSAADLSLCTLAAGAMTDPELAKLIDLHRCQWGTAEDIYKGQRRDYQELTIGKARAAANRDAAVRGLGS